MTTNREGESDRRPPYRLLGLAGVLLVPLVVVWWPGCRQYPPVTSRESLSLVRLLYSACNTKDAERLALVERRLAELDRGGKVVPEEKAGFERIIGTAKAGRWQDAERAAFKFAQDQVGQGDADPDRHSDHPTPAKKGRK